MTDDSKAQDSSSKTKMAPASNDEQFKFLISCIRYSNNGKVDFGEVARECSIVTKGAAAKRYERMMKAHGIHQTQASIRDTTINSRPKASASSKKRKIDDGSDGYQNAGDDEEGLSHVKPEPAGTKIKDKPAATTFKDEPAGVIIKDEIASTAIKAEPNVTDQVGAIEVSDEPAVMGLQTDGANDSVMFSEFLRVGAYQQRDGVEHISLDDAFDPARYNETDTFLLGNTGQAVNESILITD